MRDHIVKAQLVVLEVSFLENGLQKERILGQSLHRLHQYVHQPQSIALFLRLAPSKVHLEVFVVVVLFLTV